MIKFLDQTILIVRAPMFIKDISNSPAVVIPQRTRNITSWLQETQYTFFVHHRAFCSEVSSWSPFRANVARRPFLEKGSPSSPGELV